jgi:ABC-type Fe3+ transport system permease subunit
MGAQRSGPSAPPGRGETVAGGGGHDALARVAAPAPLGGAFWLAVGVTLGATALALVLAAATLRRRTA